MVNVSRVLPTGNTLLRASVLGCNTNPHVHSTDLKGVLPVGQLSIALFIETEIILLRFRWKSMSLCASRGPAEQQASWAGIGVLWGEVRLVSSSLWLTISNPWPWPRTCGSESCIMTSRCHDDDLSSAPSATDPGSHFLSTEATGSWLTTVLPPVLLPPSSAKWLSPWRAHRNPDHTTVAWAHHSLPEPLPWISRWPTITPEPSSYPQYSLQSGKRSSPPHSELLSSFLIQSPSAIFL